MKKHACRNSVLALVGLASLLIYVLACTSFSPDDSKVLYPTVDPKSGAFGVAVYDRASGKSELLFLPFGQVVDRLETHPILLRSQWLPDGRNVLVAWPDLESSGEAKDDGLNVAVLPFGGRGPTRLFLLSDLEESALRLMRPLPVVGRSLFLTGESNSLIRMDLETGQMRSQTGLPEMRLLSSPGGDRLFYLTESVGADGRRECGVMNPETLARTPLFQIESKEFRDEAEFFAVSREGKRLAYFAEEGNQPVCRLLESGQPARTLPLPSGNGDLEVGNMRFAPKGDVLYAAFMNRDAGRTNFSFGFFEIPIDGAPARQTSLISGAGKQDHQSTLPYFQLEVSNDGKTLAVASTYLDLHHELNAADSALFLVDLGSPQRTVTKVPIPLQPEKPSAIVK